MPKEIISARLKERMSRADKAHRAQVIKAMAREALMRQPPMDKVRLAAATPKAIAHAAAIYDAVKAAEVPDA